MFETLEPLAKGAAVQPLKPRGPDLLTLLYCPMVFNERGGFHGVKYVRARAFLVMKTSSERENRRLPLVERDYIVMVTRTPSS
jgi:hypothetical protein